MKLYKILIIGVIVLGFILGLIGAIINDSKKNKPEEQSKEQTINPVQENIEPTSQSDNNQQDLTNQPQSTVIDYSFLSDCWSGPYAGGKRTIVICFSTNNAGKLTGYDYLILPTGEQRPSTNFEGYITKLESENKYKMVLNELGDGTIGVFEIFFDAGNPTQGVGYWKSNDGKYTRDLSISLSESGD